MVFVGRFVQWLTETACHRLMSLNVWFLEDCAVSGHAVCLRHRHKLAEVDT